MSSSHELTAPSISSKRFGRVGIYVFIYLLLILYSCMHGSMNEQTNERMDERMNERMNEWMNEQMSTWVNEKRGKIIILSDLEGCKYKSVQMCLVHPLRAACRPGVWNYKIDIMTIDDFQCKKTRGSQWSCVIFYTVWLLHCLHIKVSCMSVATSNWNWFTSKTRLEAWLDRTSIKPNDSVLLSKETPPVCFYTNCLELVEPNMETTTTRNVPAISSLNCQSPRGWNDQSTAMLPIPRKFNQFSPPLGPVH